jgi:hypothetical protein
LTTFRIEPTFNGPPARARRPSWRFDPQGTRQFLSQPIERKSTIAQL